MSTLTHTPVLSTETLDLLNLRTEQHVIDCTLGLAGHSGEILKRIGPKGRLLAFEQDEKNLKEAKARLEPFESQVITIHDNFEHLKRFTEKHHFKPVHAILMDLGLSSPHVDDPERGFSFRKDGPLDMRFDPRQLLTAERIINTCPEKELADILFFYGEEKQARTIAKALVQARLLNPFLTTRGLADFIEKIIKKHGKTKIHPATLTFQALRIAVNRELEVLEKALDQAVELLAPDGRLVVISYHSLEDRIVKNKFRHFTRTCICPKELPLCQCNFKKTLYILTKKPIIPSGIEVSGNPRARSAKLRAAQKL